MPRKSKEPRGARLQRTYRSPYYKLQPHRGGLTRRQLEVLGCYLDGAERRVEVAEILGCSQHTIDKQHEKIYKTLGVISIHGAVCKVVRLGLMRIRAVEGTSDTESAEGAS